MRIAKHYLMYEIIINLSFNFQPKPSANVSAVELPVIGWNPIWPNVHQWDFKSLTVRFVQFYFFLP